MNATESVTKILLGRFREESKSRTLFYQQTIVGTISENPRVWGYRNEMYSWSFETFDFKPTKQSIADILVFRHKKHKGQKKCNCRIVHRIQR